MFRQMRRKQQMLTEQECIDILNECTSGVLAVSGDEGYPYAVPLSYACDRQKIYFHVAREGHKLDAINANDKVSFCVIAQDDVMPDQLTTYYRSVIVFGRAAVLTDEVQKRRALDLLCDKYNIGEAERENEIRRDFTRLEMIALDIEHMSGKECRELRQKKSAGLPANFRDLGGLPTKDGKVVAPYRLLRSGELSGITDDGAALLAQTYHLKKILDLRTEDERLSAPNKPVAGAQNIVLSFFDKVGIPQKDGDQVGSMEQMKLLQNTEVVHGYMESLYRSFITKAQARAALNQLLHVLLDTPEGAVLFHCFAGKDRTGISAAVILTILGVDQDLIMQDYLKTNEMRRAVNEQIVAHEKAKMMQSDIFKSGQIDIEQMAQALFVALNVDARYLQASFDAAKAEYGSFENYISEGIGITREEQEQLKKMYLV